MHVTAVISTTDMITFTTHLHTVPHGPRCSKNAPSFPSLLPTPEIRIVRASGFLGPGEPGNCARTGRFGGEGEEQVRKRARKMQNYTDTTVGQAGS